MQIYVILKVRIQTIRRFCCTNLGSKVCSLIQGSYMQTSVIHGNKAHDRSCKQGGSVICGNKATINRACKVCSAIGGKEATIDCTRKAA